MPLQALTRKGLDAGYAMSKVPPLPSRTRKHTHTPAMEAWRQ